MFMEDFAGRLPSPTRRSSQTDGGWVDRRRPLILMIAAIALSQGASGVTRNVADFEACGIAVVNPWPTG